MSIELVPGEIVQLGENAKNPMFAFCMMIVTEPRDWGAIGYVQMPGTEGKHGGQAFYRAADEEIYRTGGLAPWMKR
jgi:hypothetical protein